MRRAPLRFDPNHLLSGGLLALLLFMYIALVYVPVITLGAWWLGNLRDINFRPPWWLNFLAFALIIITLRPVTRWLRGRINDLVYAQHDDSYTLISKVNQRLQGMTSPQLTLPGLAEAIAHELRLSYLVIETTHTLESWRCVFGEPPPHALVNQIPIAYLDKAWGRLHIAARGTTQPLSESELALLGDIAQQLGIALHTAQLTGELQHARERLVVTREEERRRLRRDLHDGLGPTLAALTAQAEAARDLIPQRPDQSVALLEDMVTQAQTATADIRRLVYNLRPPALDDLGLLGAIQAQAQRINQTNGLTVNVAAGLLPALPAAVEVAAYRIVQEALANVVRHAHATLCDISIVLEPEHLRLAIEDDGRGLPEKVQAGVGLVSMRERAEELGGELVFASTSAGTKINAQLPLIQIHPQHD